MVILSSGIVWAHGKSRDNCIMVVVSLSLGASAFSSQQTLITVQLPITLPFSLPIDTAVYECPTLDAADSWYSVGFEDGDTYLTGGHARNWKKPYCGRWYVQLYLDLLNSCLSLFCANPFILWESIPNCSVILSIYSNIVSIQGGPKHVDPLLSELQ